MPINIERAKQKVAAYLQRKPRVTFTANYISLDIDMSHSAVCLALNALCDDGLVDLDVVIEETEYTKKMAYYWQWIG